MTKENTQYNRHIAIAYCGYCWKLMVSSGGGLFVSCDCKESFIDQERFSAHYVRLGGNNIKFLGQICPPDCKEKLHKNNLRIKYDKNNSPSITKSNIQTKGQKRKAIVRNKRA